MKKIGEYTTRGTINTDNALNRIVLFDGRFDTAYKVTKFQICTHDVDQTAFRSFTAKLMTDEDAMPGINFNFDNNEEIGWAMFAWDANGTQSFVDWQLIDPDNLVVQDLFILADEGVTSADVKMNYYIEMEKYDISDSKGALAMVRNRSQA